jgi:hypothetical protein
LGGQNCAVSRASARAIRINLPRMRCCDATVFFCRKLDKRDADNSVNGWVSDVQQTLRKKMRKAASNSARSDDLT